MKWLMLYLLIINVIAFVMYGIDKNKAKNGQWRIPESTLLSIAIIGGSVGAVLGMRIFRHKTMHFKFAFGLPVILIIQIVVAYCFFDKLLYTFK